MSISSSSFHVALLSTMMTLRNGKKAGFRQSGNGGLLIIGLLF
jgi:hypothetical protein